MRDHEKEIHEKLEKLKESFKQFAADLQNPHSEIREQLREIGKEFERIERIFGSFADMVGGPLNAALLLLGAWVAMPAIAGVIQLGAALLNLIPIIGSLTISLGALAIAAWPVTLAIAAIGAAGWLMYSNWQSISAQMATMPIFQRARWEEWWRGQKEATQANWESVKGYFNEFMTWVHGWADGPVNAIKDAFGVLVGWFETLWKNIEEPFKAAMDRILGLLAQLGIHPTATPAAAAAAAPAAAAAAAGEAPGQGGARPNEPPAGEGPYQRMVRLSRETAAATRPPLNPFHFEPSALPYGVPLPQVAVPPTVEPMHPPLADPSLRQLHDHLTSWMPLLPQVGPLPRLAAIPEPHRVSFHVRRRPTIIASHRANLAERYGYVQIRRRLRRD